MKSVERLDPEDPRCARVTFFGTVELLKESSELDLAKQALFTRHPSMKYWSWFASHSFYVVRLDIQKIWMVDWFGGMVDVTLGDYFATGIKTTDTL